MIERPVPAASHGGHARKLWALVLVILLIAIVPPFIDRWESRDQARANTSADGPVAAMVTQVKGYSQKTIVLVVAALSFWYFRKLVPVVSALVFSSLSGLLVAAEIGSCSG